MPRLSRLHVEFFFEEESEIPESLRLERLVIQPPQWCVLGRRSATVKQFWDVFNA